jgi:hemin uptake protein HemP
MEDREMNAPFHPAHRIERPRTVSLSPEPRPVHDARHLTNGQREAEVLLDGMRYVLRITRQGKLILTK